MRKTDLSKYKNIIDFLSSIGIERLIDLVDVYSYPNGQDSDDNTDDNNLIKLGPHIEDARKSPATLYELSKNEVESISLLVKEAEESDSIGYYDKLAEHCHSFIFSQNLDKELAQKLEQKPSPKKFKM